VGANRMEDGEQSSLEQPRLLQAAETLRSVAAGRTRHKRKTEPQGEEKMSLFWRVFGSTLLSIGALIVLTVYQQFSTNLNELRAGLDHLAEVQADLVKKDDLNNRATGLWESIKEAGNDVSQLKTKAALLENQAQELEKERKELHDKVEQLSERLAALEARQRVPVCPTLKVPGGAAGAGE
jgi:methyl-accepting chemotaxis protein